MGIEMGGLELCQSNRGFRACAESITLRQSEKSERILRNSLIGSSYRK